LKAVLFDLGGTLTRREAEDRSVDESALGFLTSCLTSEGCEMTKQMLFQSYWDHYGMINDLRERFMIEIPMRIWLSSFLCKLGISVTNEIVSTTETALVNARVETAVPFTEALDVLEKISSEYRLAIVTNTSSEKVPDMILKRLGMSRFFEFVVTSAEFGIRKPYPGIFLYALRELYLRPEEAFFVGDSLRHDILGSRSINMASCLINREETHLGKGLPAPNFILKSLSELPQTVGSFNR
jgi:HAD superfamily hydrolase (TIGR01549 family)